MESDDEVLFIQEVTEFDTNFAFPRNRREIEIGSGISNLQCHVLPV
jgi:hypothetical protein